MSHFPAIDELDAGALDIKISPRSAIANKKTQAKQSPKASPNNLIFWHASAQHSETTRDNSVRYKMRSPRMTMTTCSVVEEVEHTLRRMATT